MAACQRSVTHVQLHIDSQIALMSRPHHRVKDPLEPSTVILNQENINPKGSRG